jgi:hypothetical protein
VGYLKEMISINIYTKLIDKILNAQEWLENNNVAYKIDMNWPLTYCTFKFYNKADANIFALKWV